MADFIRTYGTCIFMGLLFLSVIGGIAICLLIRKVTVWNCYDTILDRWLVNISDYEAATKCGIERDGVAWKTTSHPNKFISPDEASMRIMRYKQSRGLKVLDAVRAINYWVLAATLSGLITMILTR